jgi:hypothetical protein
VNYKAIAEHLAKRCRVALEASTSMDTVPPEGGIYVGRPYKGRDINADQLYYAFVVSEMSAPKKWFRSAALRAQQKASPAPFRKWGARIIVYQSGEIFVEEDPAHASVPDYVRDCFTRGR